MVPSTWNYGTLDATGIKVIDGDRGKEYPKFTDFSENGYCLFLTAKNVTKSGFLFNEVQFIDSEKDKALRKGRVKRGNLVLTTRGSIGQFAHYTDSVPYDAIRINSGMVVLDAEKSELLPDFFYALCRSYIIQKQIAAASFGSAQPQLTVEIIKKFKLPIPPLSEQKKIAQILSTWDKAITTTEQLLANSQQQKKALMQQLLTGKKRLLDKNGVRFSGEWRKLPFSDLVSLVKTKFDPKTNTDDVRECIELEHITQVSSSLCGSTNTTDAVSTKTAFEKGDVLFGKLRPYLRKYWKADRQGVCSTEIWVFRTKAKVAADYIFQVVQLGSFIEVSNKSSGTHMPRADWNVVKDFLIPTPPLEEQQKIAAVLSTADQETTALQQKLHALKQEKKALMQQLLTGKRRVKIQ